MLPFMRAGGDNQGRGVIRHPCYILPASTRNRKADAAGASRLQEPHDDMTATRTAPAVETPLAPTPKPKSAKKKDAALESDSLGSSADINAFLQMLPFNARCAGSCL